MLSLPVHFGSKAIAQQTLHITDSIMVEVQGHVVLHQEQAHNY